MSRRRPRNARYNEQAQEEIVATARQCGKTEAQLQIEEGRRRMQADTTDEVSRRNHVEEKEAPAEKAKARARAA
jgi:hypothetical protein